MYVGIWILVTGVIYGTAAIIMDQTKNTGRLLPLGVFFVAAVVLWLTVMRSQVGHQFHRRMHSVVCFVVLVTGMCWYGNLLYPGFFPKEAAVADRVYAGLTLGGWTAASVVAPFLVACGRLLHAAWQAIRAGTGRRPTVLRWMADNWPTGVTMVLMLGSWLLLRLYGPVLGSMSAASWLVALDQKAPWPIPWAVALTIGVLAAWNYLVHRLHGVYHHQPGAAIHYQLLRATLIWGVLVDLLAPAWAGNVVGYHPFGGLTSWPVLWASAFTWTSFYLVVLVLALITVIAIQIKSRMRRPASGASTLVPPIPIKRRDSSGPARDNSVH